MRERSASGVTRLPNLCCIVCAGGGDGSSASGFQAIRAETSLQARQDAQNSTAQQLRTEHSTCSLPFCNNPQQAAWQVVCMSWPRGVAKLAVQLATHCMSGMGVPCSSCGGAAASRLAAWWCAFELNDLMINVCFIAASVELHDLGHNCRGASVPFALLLIPSTSVHAVPACHCTPQWWVAYWLEPFLPCTIFFPLHGHSCSLASAGPGTMRLPL